MARRELTSWLLDAVNMIFPRVCCVCHRSLVAGERVLCLHCLDRLPRTMIHRNNFNSLHQRLAGHTPVERAAAWFHYIRGSEFVSIIHDAKYRGMPDIARDSGEIFAREILPDGFFDGIDIILPVPLHRAKFLTRGYNQAREIASGISRATGIPVGDNLEAKHGHTSQTRRNAWERFLNSRNIFTVTRPDMLARRHVLVVDDVITTGATMLACIDTIHAAEPSAVISVLALGATRLS